MNELTPRILLKNSPYPGVELVARGWKACAEADGPYGNLVERFVYIEPRACSSPSLLSEKAVQFYARNEYVLELGGVQRPLILFKGKWCVVLPCGYAPLGQFMRMRGWTDPGGPSFQCRCGPKSLKAPHFRVQVVDRTRTKHREVRLCPACYAVFEDTMLEKGFAR